MKVIPDFDIYVLIITGVAATVKFNIRQDVLKS